MIIRAHDHLAGLYEIKKISRVSSDSLFYIMFINVELEIPRVKFYVY